MATVQWLKLSVDMFDNRKIKYLRRLPEGNDFTLIWVMLLTLAGKCNEEGLIYLAKDFPYTAELLADELGFEKGTMRNALAAFKKLGMAEETEEGYLRICSWTEHQNTEGLEKIREQNRLRKQKQRQREKEQSLSLSDECHEECPSEQNTPPRDDPAAVKNKKNTLSSREAPEERSEFVPPTLDEVKEYIRENNLSVDPKGFFGFYEAANWFDSRGQKVHSWKQKLLTWDKNPFDLLKKKPEPEPELHEWDFYEHY